MKITKITLYHLKLPLITTFKTGFGVIDTKNTVIVELKNGNGLVGFGEAAALSAPLYNYETSGTCFHILRDFIAPAVLNGEFEDVEDFRGRYRFVRGHNFAKTGIECAFWDLFSQEKGISLASLIGGSRNEILVGESIGIKATIAELLEEVEQRLNEGYKRIKIKIEPGWDLKPLEQIRSAFGDIPLMVDANASYTIEHLGVFQQMDKYNLLMIEQPFSENDLYDHSRLQAVIETPVCLDESIKDAFDMRKAVEMGSCRIVNIKVCRVGGLLESIKIHDIGLEADIPVWCGGMFESGIGRAYNIALASLPNCTHPADLSPSRYFYREDLIEPTYEVVEGVLQVPGKTGMGFTVARDRIEKYTVQREEIQQR